MKTNSKTKTAFFKYVMIEDESGIDIIRIKSRKA